MLNMLYMYPYKHSYTSMIFFDSHVTSRDNFESYHIFACFSKVTGS